jgi:ribonucleoside-diphosphate reductase alpha chain
MEINAEWGEPNFYFTDDYDYIGNPCVEIGMYPIYYGLSGVSFCNVTEINLALCRKADDVFKAARAAAIIGTLQAAYTDFSYLGKTTEKIVRREALIGVSMTGMADSPELAFGIDIQQQAARIVVETNQEWAAILGINPAARATCIKPSGTASLVLECASGVHSHHARRYFRRVTANPNERPAQYFKQINPHMVEEKQNGDWALVFPTEAPENALTIKDESAVVFMERVFKTYDNWIVPGTAIPYSAPGLTHNVSATVCLSEGERGEVLEKIWKNRYRIAAMAFAPKNVDKLYPHAPREAITTAGDEARWNEIISKYTPIDWLKYHEEEDETSHTLEPACAGGVCEL